MQALRVGGWQVDVVETGSFALDGGAMFGRVPQALWQRRIAPDRHNRIPLASRGLLLRRGERIVLVDTGLGAKLTGKDRAIFAVDEGWRGGLINNLARLGVAPEDVTDVVMTHLHFDHAGGLTRPAAPGATTAEVPTFPRALVHVQEGHLRWAENPSPLDRASFRREDWRVLRREGRLEVHRGDVQLFEGLRLSPLQGHTMDMNMVLVGEGEGTLAFPSDLIPTAAHLDLPYVMGFDLQPLKTVEEKERFLATASAEGWWLVLQHDPTTAGGRVEPAGRPGRYVLAERL